MTDEMSKQSYCSPSKAATITGLTLNYIYNLLSSGKIKGAKLIDRRWQVPLTWVQEKIK